MCIINIARWGRWHFCMVEDSQYPVGVGVLKYPSPTFAETVMHTCMTVKRECLCCHFMDRREGIRVPVTLGIKGMPHALHSWEGEIMIFSGWRSDSTQCRWEWEIANWDRRNSQPPYTGVKQPSCSRHENYGRTCYNGIPETTCWYPNILVQCRSLRGT